VPLNFLILRLQTVQFFKFQDLLAVTTAAKYFKFLDLLAITIAMKFF